VQDDGLAIRLTVQYEGNLAKNVSFLLKNTLVQSLLSAFYCNFNHQTKHLYPFFSFLKETSFSLLEIKKYKARHETPNDSSLKQQTACRVD